MPYAWIIDLDHEAEEDPTWRSEVGVCGPFDASDELLARLDAGEGEHFIMGDDDGFPYYMGRLVTSDPDEMDTEEVSAAPLDDFGVGNAGCTWIEWPDHPEWAIG